MTSKGQENDEQKKQWAAYARYGGSVFQMIGVLLLAIWGGRKLDKHFQLKFPAFLLSFLLIGLGASMYSLIRKAMKDQ